MTARFNGIAFPFAKGDASFPNTVTDDELIKQSLVQIIMTERGERIMRPDFGSRARSFVFANNDEIAAQMLQMDIRSSIAKFEPRVLVTSVEFLQDDTTITITINYIILASGQAASVPVALPVPQG